jgi:S1-C subfamily serine protease
LPLLLLLLLFGMILIWLLLPGTRLFQPVQVSIVDDNEAIVITEEVNRGLRKRLATLQAAVEGAQCKADGTLLVPGGVTIEGLLPPTEGEAPGKRTEAAPESVLTPDPSRVAVTEGTDAAEITQTNLLRLLEERTVLIIATNNGQVSGSGSGFFVGPDKILTNFHVIQGANNIYVTNHSLGKIRDAEILKTMGPFGQTGGDFALLKVANMNHSYYSVLQSEAPLKLKSVIAAGYPGDVLATDSQFADLRAGNENAVPDLTVTDGVVNTEQDVLQTTRVVVHSAPISQGNSGGPLVDMCGRVVGVNTFVRQGNMRNLNFALATSGFLDFLRDTGTQPTVVSEACQPQIHRPVVPPATEAATLTPLE